MSARPSRKIIPTEKKRQLLENDEDLNGLDQPPKRPPKKTRKTPTASNTQSRKADVPVQDRERASTDQAEAVKNKGKLGKSYIARE